MRVAGLAAAAAVVSLIAIALPRLGSGSAEDRTAAGAQEQAAPTTAGRAAQVEHETTNYSPESLQALAVAKETAFGGAATAADSTSPRPVLRCIRAAFPAISSAAAVRLIQARFEGAPAYIGVFEQPSVEGASATTRTVLAVATEGCKILSYARASSS